MNTPLRWVYPASYKSLEALAEKAGVHPYEYQALVDIGSPVGQVVKLQRATNEWSHAFVPEELANVSKSLMDFFSATVQQMAEMAQEDYHGFMAQRDV